MDIQKIIEEVVSKLKLEPDTIKSFATAPVGTLKKEFNIDLPEEQLNEIIKGVKDKVDLTNLDLGSLGEEATGILGKLKGLFGK